MVCQSAKSTHLAAKGTCLHDRRTYCALNAPLRLQNAALGVLDRRKSEICKPAIVRHVGLSLRNEFKDTGAILQLVCAEVCSWSAYVSSAVAMIVFSLIKPKGGQAA